MNGKNKKNILVVGDILIDRYLFVDSKRKDTTNGIPVWDVIDTENRPGGAANVAANIKALLPESSVTLVGLNRFGSKYYGWDFLDNEIISGSNSLTKNRIVEDVTEKTLLRYDCGLRFSEEDLSFLKGVLRTVMFDSSFDAVVFSDYDKGTIDEEVYNFCNKSELIVVDSKRKDLSLYKGACILKLNELEYNIQNGLRTNLEADFDCVVVTKGKNGSDLRINDSNFHKKQQGKGKSVWFPGSSNKQVKEVYTTQIINFPVKQIDNLVDSTGAGDSHTAALTVALLKGMDIVDAVPYANSIARNVVQQFGTTWFKEEKTK